GQLVGIRRLFECLVTHGVSSQGRVTDIRGVVDGFRNALYGIEVATEAVPGPLNALRHGLAGDVLGSLEVAHHQRPLRLWGRRQGEATVSHHHRGHAVVGGAAAEWIPEDLRVHMSVAVDEPGCHHMALGIDFSATALVDAANSSDDV